MEPAERLARVIGRVGLILGAFLLIVIAAYLAEGFRKGTPLLGAIIVFAVFVGGLALTRWVYKGQQ